MKTLEDHIILYDAECPRCGIYTKAFVKSGMLSPEGRRSYQHMPEAICPVVDRQRAVNEIALVNKNTGEVEYGIASLFTVIGHSFPALNPLFSCRPFSWLMHKLYAFISYNRKVIIPAVTTDPMTIQPSFRLDYRIAYLIFTWLVTSCVLTAYAHLLKPLLATGNAYREFIICGAQIIFQGVIVHMLAPAKQWAYLGNMMTISLSGALLLLPVLILGSYFPLPAATAACYFMAVAAMMLLEHIRRTRIAGLSWQLTVSWIVYRLLVLLLIIELN